MTTKIELVDNNCGRLDETLEICLPLTCVDTIPKIKDSATVFPSFFFVRRTVATLLLKLYNTRCCNASQKHSFKDSAAQLSLWIQSDHTAVCRKTHGQLRGVGPLRSRYSIIRKLSAKIIFHHFFPPFDSIDLHTVRFSPSEVILCYTARSAGTSLWCPKWVRSSALHASKALSPWTRWLLHD